MGLFDWLRGSKAGKGVEADRGNAIGTAVRAPEKQQSTAGVGTVAAPEPGQPAGEQHDADLVQEALAQVQQGQSRGARALLLDVISRAPAPHDYQHDFEADGKLHVKFWDMAEFLAYVAWMRGGEGPARDVVWLPNAYPRAFYYLGYLHIDAGDLDGALHYLDQGLLLEPASAKLKCEKAQALIRAHRQQDALELYDEVLNTAGFLADTDRALALRGRGFVLIERRELDGAEAAFRESQRYDPTSVMARNELEYIAQLRRRSAQTPQGPPSIARQLGICQDLFDIWYRRYTAALQASERPSDWNTDVDDLARQVGALTEQEITCGQTDLHQAVLNRIKLRIAMSRRNID